MEEWKEIEGFKDYLISNYGRIWSKKSGVNLKQRIRSKTCPYLSVRLKDRGRERHENVHRLVAEAFLVRAPGKTQVNHIDGNKLNNRSDNLEWVSPSENALHAHKMGFYFIPSDRTKMAIKSRQRRVRLIETGEVFESVVESAKAVNGQHSGVAKCLSGERTHYKGYHFAYAD